MMKQISEAPEWKRLGTNIMITSPASELSGDSTLSVIIPLFFLLNCWLSSVKISGSFVTQPQQSCSTAALSSTCHITQWQTGIADLQSHNKVDELIQGNEWLWFLTVFVKSWQIYYLLIGRILLWKWDFSMTSTTLYLCNSDIVRVRVLLMGKLIVIIFLL